MHVVVVVVQVDLLLQPSWTWGAILTRHMEGDSVRAVENGFSIFRCSSEGESGVVGRWVQLCNTYTYIHICIHVVKCNIVMESV